MTELEEQTTTEEGTSTEDILAEIDGAMKDGIVFELYIGRPEDNQPLISLSAGLEDVDALIDVLTAIKFKNQAVQNGG